MVRSCTSSRDCRSRCSGRECGGTIKWSNAKYHAMWCHLDKSPPLGYSATVRGDIYQVARLLANESVSGMPITSQSLGNDLYGSE
jgi:hypothetical protein